MADHDTAQPAWLRKVIELCGSHARSKEKCCIPTGEERGYVYWLPEAACAACAAVGIFRAVDIDCGRLYECATLDYCPQCHEVDIATTDCNFAAWNQTRFLPILKRKLIEHPELRAQCDPSGTCSCGGEKYTFYKDLGAIDFYDNYWTVCTNPDCTWEGSHTESYESSY